MGHEPSGLESDAEGAVKLVAADALLGGAHQVDRLKPEVHRNVTGLKDGADLHGERLPAGVALVGADAGRLPPHLGHALALAALRAGSPMRPNAGLDKGVGGFLVVEVRSGKVGHGVWSDLRGWRG